MRSVKLNIAMSHHLRSSDETRQFSGKYSITGYGLEQPELTLSFHGRIGSSNAVNSMLRNTVQIELSHVLYPKGWGTNMNSVNVGGRIRQLRLSLGMSVRSLAAKTGFSPSLISQVEHGQVTPSIGSLERIAMALGVSLGKFFSEPDTDAVGLVRASARQQLTSTWSPVSIEALSSMDGAGKLESVLMTLAPGGRSGKYPATAAGERFAFIVEGEVTLTLGDEVYMLGKGDAVTFAPANPHQWENTGVGTAQVMIVAGRFLQ
jgi:transcriptional regulator with XRE-family HTH domain